MLMKLSVLLSSIMCGIVISYVNHILLDVNIKKLKTKFLFSTILIVLILFFSYKIKYNAESNLFRTILYILTFKLLYNESTYKVVISTFITTAIMAGCDLISSLVFISFVTAEQVRSIWYWILLGNIVVCALTILVFYIPKVRDKLRKFIYNLDENSKFSTFFLLLISVLVIIYMIYNVSTNYTWGENYIISIIIGLSFLIIVIIFLKDRINYYSLMKKYDMLFEWLNELENSVEESYIINHEYKNQLAVIRGYIKEKDYKQANQYIDDIIDEVNTDEIFEMSKLKYVPKGGIKGLLYYKILSAKNKKVSIALDISDKVTSTLSKLTRDENKVLSKTLGVYLDNAIEAAMLTSKKIVNLEMYLLDNDLYIVISNPFKKDTFDIKSVNKRGYTTKGKGHGQGLYLITKTLKRYNWLSSDTKIINNYFIQKVKIDTKKITS